jgi:hypothetical protein
MTSGGMTRGAMTRGMHRARLERAASVVAAVGVTSSADACPSCATGRQARSEVWNDDFGFHLFAALLPYLLIGAICIYAERGRRK